MSPKRVGQHKGDSLLIVILVILALPAVFLFGIMFGSGTKFSELRNAEKLGLWVSALATVAILNPSTSYCWLTIAITEDGQCGFHN